MSADPNPEPDAVEMPGPNGRWVRYDALLAERSRAEARVRELEANLAWVRGSLDTAEKSRDSLRDQLRRVEGERDGKQKLLDKLALDLGAAYDHSNALEADLLARRAADADVRACAEYVRDDAFQSNSPYSDRWLDRARRLLARRDEWEGKKES